MAKKKVITLDEAIELKQTIQDLLTQKRTIFKLENCTAETGTRNYDLKKVLKEGEQLSEWFVDLKLKIQAANLLVPEGEENSVAKLLYTLSETKSNIINFKAALNKSYWKEGPKVEEEKELIYKPLYTREKIEEWLSVLGKKHFFIEGEMDRLNSTITVEIPFDPSDLQK